MSKIIYLFRSRSLIILIFSAISFTTNTNATDKRFINNTLNVAGLVAGSISDSDYTTGLQRQLKRYKALFGIEASTDGNWLTDCSCPSKTAECIRSARELLQLQVAEFGSCRLQRVSEDEEEAKTFFSIHRTLARPTQKDLPIAGSSVLVGPSCRVMITAAHNLLRPPSNLNSSNRDHRAFFSTIDDGTGRDEATVQIDWERSYFGTVNWYVATSNPDLDYAIIVLKTPALNESGNCDYVDWLELNQDEAIALNEEDFTVVGFSRRIDSNEWLYQSTCNRIVPKLPSEVEKNPLFGAPGVIFSGRAKTRGLSGGAYFTNPENSDERRKVFAINIGSLNDGRQSPPAGMPATEQEAGGFLSVEFDQQDPRNRVVNTGRLISGRFAEELRRIQREFGIDTPTETVSIVPDGTEI